MEIKIIQIKIKESLNLLSIVQPYLNITKKKNNVNKNRKNKKKSNKREVIQPQQQSKIFSCSFNIQSNFELQRAIYGQHDIIHISKNCRALHFYFTSPKYTFEKICFYIFRFSISFLSAYIVSRKLKNLLFLPSIYGNTDNKKAGINSSLDSVNELNKSINMKNAITNQSFSNSTNSISSSMTNSISSTNSNSNSNYNHISSDYTSLFPSTSSISNISSLGKNNNYHVILDLVHQFLISSQYNQIKSQLLKFIPFYISYRLMTFSKFGFFIWNNYPVNYLPVVVENSLSIGDDIHSVNKDRFEISTTSNGSNSDNKELFLINRNTLGKELGFWGIIKRLFL